MMDLMDVSNEIQETLGRSYNVPDDIDEDELMGGKQKICVGSWDEGSVLLKLFSPYFSLQNYSFDIHQLSVICLKHSKDILVNIVTRLVGQWDLGTVY